MTRDELRGFDGARVAVIFVLVDETGEAWFRTLRLDWRGARAWLGDEDGNGWFLDEEMLDRIRVFDDDLRDSLDEYPDDTQLFLSLDVSNMPEERGSITMTGLRIPRSSPG